MHGLSALAIDQALSADDLPELAQLETLLDAAFMKLDVPKQAVAKPRR